MSLLVREVRYAARRWLRTPAVSVVVAVSLALGIGANAAVFGVLRGVVLAPYDLPELDRLVSVTRANEAQGRSGWPLPPQEFRDWRDQATSFSGMAASQVSFATLTSEGAAERLAKANVTDGFFTVLGRPLALGRAPTEAESVFEGPAVIVLSNRLWATRFGGDPSLVGRTITLDGVETEVIGVTAPGFDYPEGTDLWAPLQLNDDLAASRTFHTLHTVGRLADDAPLERARAELTTITERLEAAFPESNRGERAEVRPLAQAGLGSLARGLTAVFVGAGLVLLLTCLNISVLLFVRSLEASRESAIRAAMGADRRRMIAPIAADVILLASCSIGLGVPLALGLLAAIRSGAGALLPHATRIGLGAQGVGLIVGLTALACCACAAAPAWRALRATDTAALRAHGSGWGRRSGQARRALIALEMTLALVTLVGAGLLLRTFAAYSAVDTGIDAGDGLVFTVTLPGASYEPGSDAVAGFFAELHERVGALPSVEAVGGSAWLPWMGPVAQLYYTLDGMGELADAEKPVGSFQTVSGRYFAATGIDVLEGRVFDETDRADAQRVAVVSETFVRTEGLEGTALGATVSIEIGPEEGWERTIVGIVEDVPTQGLDQAHLPALYTPLTQVPWSTQEIVARASGDPEALVTPVRRALSELDPDLAVYGATTLDAVLASTTAQPRVQMQLLVAFAVLAVILAVVGAYGVLSFVVATRSREIGVRMAVGATRADVRGLVLREGLTSVAAGALVGLVSSAAGARLLQGVLFGVDPHDPRVYGVAAGILTVAGLLAAVGPSLRAGRVEPRAALTGTE